MKSGRVAQARTRKLIASPASMPTRRWKSIAASLGRTVGRCAVALRLSGREAPDETRDAVRGVVVGSALLMVWIHPVAAGVLTVIGWHLPRLVDNSRRSTTNRSVADEVLLASELCAVAFRGGATVPQALAQAASHVAGPFGQSLARADAVHRGGSLLVEELGRVSDDFGDPASRLMAVLSAAHLDGDHVVAALDRLIDQLRNEQRRALDVEVRRLSVRLLLPLVCCSLPGFVLIGIVPAMSDAVAQLLH